MASTAALLSTAVDYYNDEEELDSVDDDERSFRGRDSEEGKKENWLTHSKEIKEQQQYGFCLAREGNIFISIAGLVARLNSDYCFR